VIVQSTNGASGTKIYDNGPSGAPAYQIVNPAQAAALLPADSVVGAAIPGAHRNGSWSDDPGQINGSWAYFAVEASWTTGQGTRLGATTTQLGATTTQLGATVTRFPDPAHASAWAAAFLSRFTEHFTTRPIGIKVPGLLPPGIEAVTYTSPGAASEHYEASFAEGSQAFVVSLSGSHSQADERSFVNLLRGWLVQLKKPPALPPPNPDDLIPLTQAESTAAGLLDRLPTPPGSTLVLGLPGSAFSQPQYSSGCNPLVDETRFWVVPGQPLAVASFFRSHPLAGFSIGYGTGPGAGTYSVTDGGTIPSVQADTVDITLAATAAGTTGIRADAQVVPHGASCINPGGPPSRATP
jgi:hypothetical protein